MEKKNSIQTFQPPICRIHQSEDDILSSICFHNECPNNFKPVCLTCVTD